MLMGLVFRVDKEEKVLRSVGDAPNGIIGMALNTEDGGATFVVDPGFEPSGRQGPQIEGPPPDASTPVTVAELIEGCASDVEVAFVWTIAYGTAEKAVGMLAPVGNFDGIRAQLDLCEEVYRAILERAQ